MGPQDEFDPVERFLYDPEYDRAVEFYAGSSSAPRQPPLAGLGDHSHQFWSTPDAAVYASSEYPAYTTSSTGARTIAISALGDDDEYEYDDDSCSTPADFMRRGRSSRTAAHRAPSSPSSDASSVASSIFSRPSATTSSGISSRPPRRADMMNFNQTLAATEYAPVANTQPVAPASSRPLWCELCVLGDCPATFAIEQTDEWIEHHCRHLKEQFPTRLTCWFCDDGGPFVAAGRSRNDGYGNFKDRMEHIRGHILEGYISENYMTTDEMRPDFYMIHHLGEQGIIDTAMHDAAFGYSEVPAALLFPDGLNATAPPYNPERRPPGPSLAHDLDRERRHQRPRGGKRHRPAAPAQRL